MSLGWVEVGAIMLVAGVAGGTVNFALSRTDKSTVQDWAWAVAIGIGASFLMPLFLQTMSSELLTNLMKAGNNSSSSDLFVFSGFCLLGAIASRAMIQTLTDRVLREAKAARQEVSELEVAVAPILDKETEQDEDSVPQVEPRAPLNPEQEKVLRALEQGRFSLRSISGISKEVGLERQAVVAGLDALVRSGLASEVQGKKGKRWALSPSGRRWISG